MLKKNIRQSFNIEGLTCGNCSKFINEKLLAHSNILNVAVDKERGELIIDADKVLNAQALNVYIDNKKYSILDNHSENLNLDTKLSKLSIYWPLLLSFLFVLVLSLLVVSQIESPSVQAWMRFFMASFFLLFSLYKWLDIEGFAMSFSMYDPIAIRWKSYAWIYPLIESTLGVIYFIGFGLLYANLVTILILGLTSIGVYKTILNKQKIQCACIGSIFKLPMSKVTLIENSLMIIMASTMLYFQLA